MPREQLNSADKESIQFRRRAGGACEILVVSGVTHSMPVQISQAYSISLFEGGVATFTHKGTSHTLKQSQLLLLNPGDSFERKGSSAHPRKIRVLTIQPQFLLDRFSSLGSSENSVPLFTDSISGNADATGMFYRMHHRLEHSSSEKEQTNILEEIIDLLLDKNILQADYFVQDLYENRQVKRVRDYLNERFAEDISLDGLASMVNLSPYQLNRVFSQQVGVPPHTFLIQRRIWNAKALMANGESITSAALASGFYDQAHLSRHFKRSMGFTPGVISRSKNVQ